LERGIKTFSEFFEREKKNKTRKKSAGEDDGGAGADEKAR